MSNSENIDITTMSFDSPEALPPTHHSWLEDTVPWIRFGDGLPRNPRTSQG